MGKFFTMSCVLSGVLLASEAIAAGYAGPWHVASVGARDVGYEVKFAETNSWCGSAYFYIDTNNPRAKDMYSMLYGALLSGKAVRVYVADVCNTTNAIDGQKAQLITAAYVDR